MIRNSAAIINKAIKYIAPRGAEKILQMMFDHASPEPIGRE